MTGRDNGLTALAYVVLADVAPELADDLLEVFRGEGIAAYAAPAAPTAPATIDLRPRPEPVDRIFVDSTADQRAQVLLAERMSSGRCSDPVGPDPRVPDEHDGEVTGAEATTTSERPGKAPRPEHAPSPLDEDAAWDAIVAGWDLTAPGPPARRRPGARDPSGERSRADDGGPDADGSRGRPSGGPSGGPPGAEPPPRGLRRLRRASDHPGGRPPGRGPGGGADPEPEGYVPPPPPPVPRGDLVTRLAWTGLIGSPVLFLLVTLLDLGPLPRGVLALLLAAFVGGFVTLVARMQDRPPGSGPDDGAVV